MLINPKKIFLLALLIRLLIAPWFYHPDLKSQHFHFQFLSQGRLNIYSHISQNLANLPYTDTFNYLPLTYFTFGSIQALLAPFQPPDFSVWLNDWGENQHNYANLPFYLLILKLPYLIFDLALGYLFSKLFPKRPYFKIWLLNPISIYLIYVLGNFDILPVFLTFLSLYFLSKNSYLSSGFFFGLAVSLKLYPLMFLPFLSFPLLRSPKNLTLFLLATITPLLLTLAPFAASSDFWTSFFGSGLTQKLLEFQLLGLPVFPLLYILLFIFGRRLPLYTQLSILGLIFFSTVKFHPQWLIWFFPFFIISYSRAPSSRYLIFSFYILFFGYVFLFNDQFLTWGHLLPINPLYLTLRTPYDLLRLRFSLNPAILQIYLKYLMSGVTVLLVFWHFKSHAPDTP